MSRKYLWASLVKICAASLALGDGCMYLNLTIIIAYLNSGLYYDYPEITPHNKKGDFRYNKANEKVTKFASDELEARALIEGQFMAKRLHVEKMGFKTGKNIFMFHC